jgi:hypothetical protein
MVVTGQRRWELLFGEKLRTPLTHRLSTALLQLPSVLCPRGADSLPLHVRNRVGSTTGERQDMILPVAWTGTCREPRGRARMLPLEFPRHFSGSVLPRFQRG